MKKFIQFLTLVGELFSIYMLTNLLATMVLALIVGGGAAVALIAWIFVAVVAIFVIMPCVGIAFVYVRKFFDANFDRDFKPVNAGA